MISIDKCKRGAAVVLSIVALGLVPLKVQAQYNGQPQQQQNYVKKKQNVEKTDRLKEKITINGLPEYSG
ncbi:hypothetical protein ABTI05_19205, partial [Acinetobacter baumannii]